MIDRQIDLFHCYKNIQFSLNNDIQTFIATRNKIATCAVLGISCPYNTIDNKLGQENGRVRGLRGGSKGETGSVSHYYALFEMIIMRVVQIKDINDCNCNN